jgi:hypothetical protein
MLNTVPGSVDGFRVTTYEAGAEYDLSATVGEEALAQAFIAAGLAEEASDAKTAGDGDSQADAETPPASVDGADETPAPAKPGRKPKAQ